MSAQEDQKNSWLITCATLSASAIVLVGMHRPIGWLFWLASLLWAASRLSGQSRIDALAVHGALGILGAFPVTTETTNLNFLRMGGALLVALMLPHMILKITHQKPLSFRWHHGRRWMRREVMYLLVTVLIAYLLLPFYLQNTAAYQNWAVDATPSSIGRLFIGTNALGLWDELFFINTVLALLRRHMGFWQANLTQAVLFVSFLFELGFIGWAPFVLYPFALVQGQILRKTDSLLYVVSIHLALDLVLFLALVNAHHPHIFDIFLQ